MYRYLQFGQLSAVFGCANGPRTLFVHGGVIGKFVYHKELSSQDALGFLPSAHVGEYRYSPEDGMHASAKKNAPARKDDLLEWAQQLNEWKTAQFEEWLSHPQWTSELDEANSSVRWRGANSFQDYCLVEGKAVPSVVLGRHLQPSGMPAKIPPPLVELLNRSGIRRVIVGHTPHGNCPTVIHSKGTDGVVEVIMADTSYSDMSAKDNRGQAVSEVTVDSTGNEVHVHGVIQTGEQIEYCLKLDGEGDPFVGAEVMHDEKEWFVKAKFEARDDYLISRVWDGYKVDYATIPANALAALLKN